MTLLSIFLIGKNQENRTGKEMEKIALKCIRTTENGMTSVVWQNEGTLARSQNVSLVN